MNGLYSEQARMSAGREFQIVGAATRKLRVPKFSLHEGTVNKLEWLEHKLIVIVLYYRILSDALLHVQKSTHTR